METFVVRVWKPGAEDRPEGLRGNGDTSGVGREVVYTEPEALIRFSLAKSKG